MWELWSVGAQPSFVRCPGGLCGDMQADACACSGTQDEPEALCRVRCFGAQPSHLRGIGRAVRHEAEDLHDDATLYTPSELHRPREGGALTGIGGVEGV